MQVNLASSKRRLVRYKSSIQLRAKKEYNALKREAYGLLKALKKFRRQLFNIYFVVKTNTITLATQLNRQLIDLLGAVVNNQLIQIRRFDFNVKYISRKSNIVTNALSRRLAIDKDIEEAEEEDNINDQLKT